MSFAVDSALVRGEIARPGKGKEEVRVRRWSRSTTTTKRMNYSSAFPSFTLTSALICNACIESTVYGMLYC